MELREKQPASVSQTEIPSPWVTTKTLIMLMIGVSLIFIVAVGAIEIFHLPFDFGYFVDVFVFFLMLPKLMGHLIRKGYSIEKTFRLFSLDRKLIFPIVVIAFGLSLSDAQIEAFLRFALNHVFSLSIRAYDVGRPEFIWGWVLFFIAGVLVAPVFEELIFRGLILSSIESKHGIGKAIVWSSIIFGLIHFHPTASIVIVFEFFIVSYIVYKTNSILSGVLIHSIGNFIAMLFYPFYSPDDLGFFPHVATKLRVSLELAVFVLGVAILVTGFSQLISRLSTSSQHPLTFITDHFHRRSEICSTSFPS